MLYLFILLFQRLNLSSPSSLIRTKVGGWDCNSLSRHAQFQFYVQVYECNASNDVLILSHVGF